MGRIILKGIVVTAALLVCFIWLDSFFDFSDTAYTYGNLIYGTLGGVVTILWCWLKLRKKC
jgi:hypothetical protein